MSSPEAPKGQNNQKFTEEFLEFKRIDHRSSPLTLDAYRRDLRALMQWCSGQALETLTKADIRKYVADMKEKGFADTTIRRQGSTFNQFFTFLIDEAKVDGLNRSPIRGFKFPITNQEEANHLEPEQRKQLFDYLERNTKDGMGKLLLALFGLLYYAGLRVTEGVTRTFEDIFEDGGHQRLHILGKRNKERTAIIHSTAMKWLSIWLNVRPEIELNPNYLFIHPSRKTPISRKFVWRHLKGALHKAGLDEETVLRTSPHSLRHTRASDLRRAGYDMLIIKRFLGHASVRTTEIYTHIEDPEVDAAILGVD